MIQCAAYVLCAVWQWEGDDGQWNPYSPAACALLDSATSSGKASVTLPLGSGTAYKVDLKKMVQINPATKYKRKIRCQPAEEGLFFVNLLSLQWFGYSLRTFVAGVFWWKIRF